MPLELESETAQWIRRIVMNSPTAIACCKAALNAARGRRNGTNGWGIDAIVLHEYRVARKTGRLFRKEGAAIS